MRTLSLVIALAVAGCGSATPTVTTPTPAPAAATTAPPPEKPAPAQAADTASIAVQVVDLDGQPLPNMLPIATTQPNAFDAPVAKGALTDASGKSTLSLVRGQYLYVRAWDPTRRIFANNYFDVMAGDATTSAEPLTVTMAPGAALRMALIGLDQKPCANATIDIMMLHPQKGPWWPDRAQTDAQGVAVFPCVPPGKYGLRIKAQTGGQLELTEVALPPSGNTDLGALSLQ